MSQSFDKQQASREAFDERLPRRIAGIQVRLRTMADHAWDINTLHVLALESGGLAREAAEHGQADISTRLYGLAELLGKAIQGQGAALEQHLAGELARVLATIGDYSAHLLEEPQIVPVSTARRAQVATLAPPVITPEGLPALENVARFVVPPPGYLPEPDPAQQAGRIPAGTTFPAEDRAPETAGEPVAAPAAPAPEAAEPLAESEEIRVGRIDLIDPLADPHAPEPEPEDPAGEAGPDASGDADAATAAAVPADPTEGGTGRDLDALFAEVESDVRGDSPGAETTGAPGREEAVTPQAAAEAQTFEPRTGLLTIYLLHGEDPATAKLAELLRRRYEVQTFADPEAFMEMLGAIGPDAVLVDQSHLDRIELIGPVVEKLRAKSRGRLVLAVYAPPCELETRLKLMRAGADLFIATSLPLEIAAERIAEQMQEAPANPYRVLVVEDDDAQAMFAQSILSRAGIKTRVQQDPLKVLESLEDFGPDLVLMDLHLPGCDGMELTTIIRDQARFVHLPIVFLSGDEDEDRHFDALLAGGDDFLTKPIRPRHLISAVKNRILRARAHAPEQAARASTADASTRTARTRLLEELERRLADRGRREGGLVYLEIDRAFALRRQHGLPALERLADEVGERLAGATVQGESLARYGDTVFCLLVPAGGLGELEERARALAAEAAGQPIDAGGEMREITISAGLCSFEEDFPDADALIAAAERACNRGADEEIGRIGVHRAPGAGGDPAVEGIGDLIRRALAEDGFRMAYQPIASLHGEEVEQYQCLLRLPREDGEPLATARVIAVAEQLGLLGDIDRWVVQRVATILREESGRPRPLRLFANQSGVAAGAPATAEFIGACLRQHDVPGASLVLEFKLPDVANRLPDLMALQERLADTGVGFCLGHFDGGEAGFRMLRDYRADFVKLSPQVAFRQLQEGRLGKTVERLKEGGSRVVVVGVEEAQLAVQLWSAGVDFIQGHLVQEPESKLSYHFANVD